MAEPAPRWGHFSAPIGEQLYVWGGRIKGKSEPKSTVHTFDLLLESWDSGNYGGLPPIDGLHKGTCASSGHHLYLYGGYDNYQERGTLWPDSFYHLDTATRTWIPLHGGPVMGKDGFGMVTYHDRLVIFGGYGVPHGIIQPGATFTKDTRYREGCGWTNELHTFNLKEESWSSPRVLGTRPPPCNNFTFTLVDDHCAMLFGGECQQTQPICNNDVHLLDLMSMHWSKVDHRLGEPCPAQRMCHASVCLGYGKANPQLLVTGGLDKEEEPLGDMWMLDVKSGCWKEVKVPTLLSRCHLKSRCHHSATAFSLTPVLTEVVIFGLYGRKGHHFPQIPNTVVLQFEYNSKDGESGGWILTGVTDMPQLGTRKRIREKMLRLKEAATAPPETMLPTSKGGSDERIQDAVREKEQTEKRLDLLEQRSKEQNEKMRQLETQWAVERSEIQLTDQELGRGGWATVRVATFRGLRVAAKCIHAEIVSTYNIELFKREMDMAARIRHPNLLQFIGATQKGEMVILTELMPTTLRKELERKDYNYMSPDRVFPIGLDVARALNYLHLMQPHPLVHRDINSANVLLEPRPNGHWRAKVSDFGTVNLQENLTTACPGNPAYSAPEANDPTQQSPKMDIFSFGILLMEMLTGEFPASDRHTQLLLNIFHRPLLDLVQRCLKGKKEDRPSASDIISELDSRVN